MALLRSLKARQAADRLVIGARYPENGLVVVDRLGRPVQPSAYSDRFVILCRDAGVRQVHLHAVRHTLALMMHRAGIAPADAAALLGHTVQTHLSVYVPLTEKGARTAASGLGAAIASIREVLVKFGPLRYPARWLRQSEMPSTRFSRESNRHDHRFSARSASGDCACCHLPQIAAPVIICAGVLSAENPDLALEDHADR